MLITWNVPDSAKSLKYNHISVQHSIAQSLMFQPLPTTEYNLVSLIQPVYLGKSTTRYPAEALAALFSSQKGEKGIA